VRLRHLDSGLGRRHNRGWDYLCRRGRYVSGGETFGLGCLSEMALKNLLDVRLRNAPHPEQAVVPREDGCRCDQSD